MGADLEWLRWGLGDDLNQIITLKWGQWVYFQIWFDQQFDQQRTHHVLMGVNVMWCDVNIMCKSICVTTTCSMLHSFVEAQTFKFTQHIYQIQLKWPGLSHEISSHEKNRPISQNWHFLSQNS